MINLSTVSLVGTNERRGGSFFWVWNYWSRVRILVSSALKSGFGASFSICSDDLAQEVALVKFGDGWSQEASSNQRQGDWMERSGLKFNSVKCKTLYLGTGIGIYCSWHMAALLQVAEEEKDIILSFAKKCL